MKAGFGYVLLPQPIEEEAHKLLLKNGYEVKVAETPDPEVVAPLMKETSAIILRTGIKITEELLSKAENLLTISRTGGGVDNVDLKSATKHGIIVTSSLGVNTVSVVEHTMALILAVSKCIVLLDSEVRKGNFKIRYKNLPVDICGKTIGIVGFGRIGSGVAVKCRYSFNMKVLAYDPFLPYERKREFENWVRFCELDELFGEADIISIHLPLNDQTKGMIDKKYISLMKTGAIIVNTSRGGVINERDLTEALSKKKIAGAGLDVFENEPPDPSNPLLKLDNVVLTPHSAALTKECVRRMAVSAVERVLMVFEGKMPSNIANPEVLNLPKWKHLKR
ncbi:MAG: hydroxyacid dehydrogenase [Spirochaetes bacterium]|nr:MAG: hydroxyacid dehydrogenase [Spirochaetota bacterium]